MPQDQQQAIDIESVARSYGLDPAIMKRQVQQESGGSQGAVSPKGAIGMMQLMPETAKRLGVDPNDPAQNVRGGMTEMARLVKKYDGNYTKALAAYNAGEEAVDKAGGIPDYPETQNYVRSILAEAPQPVLARTPDGKIHQFPAGTSPDIVQKAIRAYLKLPSPDTSKAADVAKKPSAQGDVRPSVQQITNPQNTQQLTADTPITPLPGESFAQTMQRARDAAKNMPAQRLQQEMQKEFRTGLTQLPSTAATAIGIGAAAPLYMGTSILSMIKQGTIGGDRQLVGHPENAMSPNFKKAHPYLTGAAELIGGMSTPENSAMLGGLKTLSFGAKRLVGGAFATTMTADAVKNSRELYDVVEGNGDYANMSMEDRESLAKKMVFHIATNAAFAAGSAQEALETDPKTRADVRKQIVQQQKVAKGRDIALNKAIQEAAILPEKSTPMGPISQTGGQQLQVDFANKAPIEATAPVRTDGASKSASAPVVDREALIAPKPATQELDDIRKQTGLPLTDEAAARRIRERTDLPEKLGPIGVASKPRDMAELARISSLTYKGEVVPGTGVHQFEDPAKPGQTIAVRAGDIPGPGIGQAVDYLRDRVRAKGEEIATAPPKLVTEPVKVEPRPAPPFGATFDTIAQLKRDADLAENDQHATELTNKANQLEQGILGEHRQWMEQQETPTLQQYIKLSEDRATKLEAQAKGVRSLTEQTIKNRGAVKEIADMRSPGGPVRMVADPETGERVAVKPETPVKRGGRSVLDTIQGRVPTSELDSIKIHEELQKLPPEEREPYVAKLRQQRSDLAKTISDTIANTGSTEGIWDHVNSLDKLDELLGRYPEEASSGRRPNIPAKLDENGAIETPEALPSWSKERQDLALDAMGFGKPRGMLSDEELFQHADMGQEKGRLFRSLAATARDVLASRKRESQAGFLGERPQLRGKVEPVSLKDRVPDDDEMLRRATAAKFHAVRLDDEKSDIPVKGWVSPNGKMAIHLGGISHADSANTFLPEVAQFGHPMRAMLQAGWIAVHSPVDFEAWDLDRAKSGIKDMLERNGRFGAPVNIDTRTPEGRVKTLSLDSGWEDFNRALFEANKRSQIGALRGTTLASSATVGGLVGAAIGAHLGDPYSGLAVGLTSGFLAPAVMDHPAFKNAIGFIRGPLNRFGLSMKEWIAGPRQEPSLPEMESIRDAQKRDLQNPARSFVTRLQQLPADIERRWMDRLGMVNDNPSLFGKWLKNWDTRNKYFTDLRGKLDVDNSPYVSMQLAANGGSGLQEAHLMDYKDVLRRGQKAGLLEHLANYLNLKGYSRAWQVIQERVQEGAATQARLEQALKQPNLPVEVEARLKRQLRETKADIADVQDKIANKAVAPEQFDPPKIAQHMQDLQQLTGPQKFAQVKALADKVFKLNRQVLDLAHDEGIVGDEEYQKYIGRGDEYIPMHRILERVNEANGDWYGRDKSNPLYLRTSNMIKALTGSEKVNRDPITASADANMRALREITRNRAITDMLKLAQADPQGVGTYFKPVRPGYQVGPDEGIVGAYVNGQQVSFKTPSWLSETLKNVAPSSLDVLGKKPLQFFSNIMRRGATVANLGWSIPNAIRHLEDMALMSDAGLKSFNVPKDVKGLTRDYVRSIYSVLQEDGVYREAIRSGALGGTLQRAISPEKALDLNALGFRQKVAGLRLVDLTADFNRSVEDVVKTTTYRRLRENGLSEKAAAWETRRYGGGPDFAQMGTDMPVLNLLSMFFNAHMQYLGRAFTRIAEQPGRMAVALTALAAMNMALVQHNSAQRDDDGQPLMRRIDKSTRENYWVLLSGDTYKDTGNPVAYRFPKPSFAKFFSNPVENMLYKVAHVEQRNGVQLGLQALSDMAPGQVDLQQGKLLQSTAQGMFTSLNPALRAPIEEFANYSTRGRGGPIVPEREQQLSTSLQFGPQTSQVAREIGQGGVRGAVAGAAEGGTIGYLLAGPQGAAIGGGLGSIAGTYGISPRRAEHIIDTTTAGTGRIATSFVDPFLGGVAQTRTGPAILNKPIIGPIAGRFISPNINQVESDASTKFYDQVKQAQQPLKDMEFLQKNRPQDLAAYMQNNKNNIAMGHLAEGMERQMAKYNSMQRMIENNQSMNSDTKNESLKNLHAMRVKLMSVFNAAMAKSPQVGQASAFPGQGQGAPR